MSLIHVKPKPGRRVPDPATGQCLPPKGARVSPSAYWTRRLADADVEIVQPAQPKPKTKTQPPTAPKGPTAP